MPPTIYDKITSKAQEHVVKFLVELGIDISRMDVYDVDRSRLHYTIIVDKKVGVEYDPWYDKWYLYLELPIRPLPDISETELVFRLTAEGYI